MLIYQRVFIPFQPPFLNDHLLLDPRIPPSSIRTSRTRANASGSWSTTVATPRRLKSRSPKAVLLPSETTSIFYGTLLGKHGRTLSYMYTYMYIYIHTHIHTVYIYTGTDPQNLADATVRYPIRSNVAPNLGIRVYQVSGTAPYHDGLLITRTSW